MKKALVALMALAALCAVAGPAQAGDLSWDDAADDATQFLQPQTEGAFANEPALDIRKVTMASDDKALTWTIEVAKASKTPSMNSGYFFRYNFTYEGAGFAFRAGEFQGQKALQLRSTGDLIGFDLPCKDCKFELNEKDNKATLTAPIASLIDGIAAADSPTACPGCRTGEDPLAALKRGAEFTGLNINAQRYYLRVTPNADNSVAPEGSVFTL